MQEKIKHNTQTNIPLLIKKKKNRIFGLLFG